LKIFIGPPYVSREKDEFLKRKWSELPEIWLPPFTDLLEQFGLDVSVISKLEIYLEFTFCLTVGLYVGKKGNMHVILINDIVFFEEWRSTYITNEQELNLILIHELYHLAKRRGQDFSSKISPFVPVFELTEKVSDEEEVECHEAEQTNFNLKLLDLFYLKHFLRTGLVSTFENDYGSVDQDVVKSSSCIQMHLPFSSF